MMVNYGLLPIVADYAQQVANRMEQQQCLIANEFGGIDIRPIKHVVVINNPNLLLIVEPYFDPILEVRKSKSQWMSREDYLSIYNKLTGVH